MDLSKRLYTVASLVNPGDRIADIGTDHAYIPIYLARQGVISHAVAMDINEGPLKIAGEHVRDAGLQEKIVLRLSDGFAQLLPGEADTAILAGMGGNLIIRILKEQNDVTCSLKTCILQPQSEIAKVRAFLLEEGFLFIEEEMVFEDGKYYPIMKVSPPQENGTMSEKAGWDEVQIRFGKLLLQKRDAVLKQFLEREMALKTEILHDLSLRSGERIESRRAELAKELEYIREGLNYYEM